MPRPARTALAALLLGIAATGAVSAGPYDELRRTPGQAGQRRVLGSERVAGTFAWAPHDPYGEGDDGGVVIEGPNGWWVRQFPHSEKQPIELDWFEVGDGDDITALLRRLARRYAPDFFCRMPSRNMTLVVDFVDFTEAGTKRLGLLESDAAVTIRDRPAADPGDRVAMLRMADYETVRIGGLAHRLTFQGQHDGVRGGWNCKENYSFKELPPGLKHGRSLLTFEQSQPGGERFEFRANIRDSFLTGLSLQGMRHKTREGVISGDFVNCGFYIAGGVAHLHLDNPRFSDPYLPSWGWDGGDSTALNNGGQEPAGICRAQSRRGPGPLTMNGPRVRQVDGRPVVWQGRPMPVTLRSRQDLSHVQFRLRGTDGRGEPVTRAVRGPTPGINRIAGDIRRHDGPDGWIYTDKVFQTVTGVEVMEGELREARIEVGVEQYYERGRGATLMYLNRLTGSVTFEYGIPHAFPTVIEHIGNGPDEPFTIYLKDIGFTPQGVRVVPWGLADAWKSDPTGDHGPGKKYFRVVEKPHDHGFNARFDWILEATGTGRGTGYHNAHVDVACENLTSTASTAVFDYVSDWTRHTTIHGTFRTSRLPDGTVQRGTIVLCESAVVHDTDVPDIRIVARSVKPMKDGEAPPDRRLKRYPRDITIRDTRIIAGGDIRIDGGATGIALQNVAFDGRPRRVIHIPNRSDPARPVTLRLENVQAPTGSTIEADNASQVTVTLDGRAVPLPHRF